MRSLWNDLAILEQGSSGGQSGWVSEDPAALVPWYITEPVSPYPFETKNAQLRRCVDNQPDPYTCPSCRFLAARFVGQAQSNLIPYKGNTDPFHTQPITVDATANLYLGIGLKYLENHVWASGLQVWCAPRGYHAAVATQFGPGVAIKRRDEASALEVPQDDPRLASIYLKTGLAYNAWALFAVTGNRQHKISAADYTAQCVTKLRQYLSETDEQASIRPEQLIFRILRADTLGGHLASALTHALFLKRLTLARNTSGKGDPVIFNHTLYSTTNLGIALWKRPFFDPVLVEHFYVPYLAPLMLYGYNTVDMQKRMKWFTQNVRLQNLLAETAMLFSWTDSCLAGRLRLPSQGYCTLTVRAEYLILCLLNVVHDQEGQTRLHTAPPFTTALNVNTCLALTAILSLRFQKHEPMINGMPVSTISLVILRKLQTAYVHLDSSMSALEKVQFTDASLWIAFVAALVEDRFSGSVLPTSIPERWWWRRLTIQIFQRNFCTWSQLYRCLSQFPYHQDETPLPRADWLDQPFKLVAETRSVLQEES